MSISGRIAISGIHQRFLPNTNVEHGSTEHVAGVVRPNFEVVVPEEDADARRDVAPDPVTTPGIYVLQAGSYSSYGDADRAKAQLAMLGIVSRIQKISIDDKVWHRVRIGPIASVAGFDNLMGRLAALGFDEARLVTLH